MLRNQFSTFVIYRIKPQNFLSEFHDRFRGTERPRHVWHYQRPLGWQVVTLRLLDALVWSSSSKLLRRALVDITGIPSCGKGEFFEALQQRSFWEMNGLRFPEVLDASQMTGLDALLTVYRGEAIILFDFAQSVKASLAEKQMSKVLKMLEELTDYGRTFNVRGWGRGRGKSVTNNALVVIAGNEPLPVLLQKRIYSINVGPNPLNPSDEEYWKTVPPDEVRINFPGQPPIWRPPRGRLGHIARPSVLAPLDPLAVMLDAWRSASEPDAGQLRAKLPLADARFDNLVDGAQLDALLATLPAADQQTLQIALRAAYVAGHADALS